VALLVSGEERAAFLALRRDYQRSAFIERFWQARDPFPETTRNEFRDAWEERVAKARDRFPDLGEDRARVLLLLGEPGDVLKPGCRSVLRPLEIWRYGGPSRGDGGRGRRGFSLVFLEPQGNVQGRYRLWRPGHGLAFLLTWPIVGEAPDRQAAQRIVEECTDGGGVIGSLLEAADWSEIESRPGLVPRPGNEWLRSFVARSTDAPAAAPRLPAELALRFPGRHQSRTVVEAVLAVPRGALAAAGDAFRFVLDGEVLLRDELFESFRYRFELPAAGLAGDAVPLVLQRYLRPGSYRLVLKLEEPETGRVFREEREVEVPSLAAGPPPGAATSEAAAPAAPDAPAPDPSFAAALAETEAAVGAGDHSLELFAPGDELVTGRLRVEAMASGAGIDRVSFALNGRKILSKSRPPYSVELDLGRAPRTHTLQAVALDADGRPLASDELLLNAGPHRFRVRLLQPQRGHRYTSGLRASAEVELPQGERLDRVEFFLNEERVATLYQAPFVQPILLAPGEAAYVRVVAYLEDGNATEDLVFVNAPEFAEEVRVDLVEVYATVVDRRGHPVEGLGHDDFTVLEDDRPQAVRRFERVRDRSIHAGILLDVSSSMMEELPEAVRAALRFFQLVIRPQDRAAVITFNETADLAVPFTGNQEVLAGGLATLEADGETALWDSVVYALHYFSGIKGKRAIVLLSDGLDVNSRYSFEETLDYARRSGVAVYAVGLDLPQREVEARSRLQRLAEETGGRVFFVQFARELERVYGQIEQELRSQYLLAYQSTQSGDRYRAVDVKVARPGLTAKTARGYYP
jgi:VWFA-related protein